MIETLLRFAMIVLVVAVAGWAVRWLPRRLRLEPSEVEAPPGGRLQALDGLRGALAIGVFVSHADATRNFFALNSWVNHPDALRVLGELAVSLFFGITGFLFWDRALDGKVHARTLYPRRFLRIYPLYAFVAVAAVLLCLAHRPYDQDPLDLSIVLSKLLVPGRALDASINGVDLVRWMGQAWTLHYELIFYLVLPLLAPLARWRGSAFVIAGFALVLAYQLPFLGVFDTRAHFVPTLFASGIAAAEIARWKPATEALRGPLGGKIALGAALVHFGLKPNYPLVGAFTSLAILLPFVCGGDPFGVFARPRWRGLGEISYSLYLTHNLALFGLVSLLNTVVRVKSIPELLYWTFVAGVSVLAVALSLVTFRFLERPFMGKRPLPVADAAP